MSRDRGGDDQGWATSFTGDRRLMGDHVDAAWLRVINWAIVALIVGLNLVMIHWALTR